MDKTIVLLEVEQYHWNSVWMPENLSDAIKWLQTFLDSVPIEHRHSAEINIGSVSSYEDSHYAIMLISYKRPEIEAEEQELLEQQRIHTKAIETAERKKYEELKLKYGNKRIIESGETDSIAVSKRETDL